MGENDYPVIEWNREVIEKQLVNVEKKKLVVIPQSSHLFEEPGKLEEVAKQASGWFRCYFQIKQKKDSIIIIIIIKIILDLESIYR